MGKELRGGGDGDEKLFELKNCEINLKNGNR